MILLSGECGAEAGRPRQRPSPREPKAPGGLTWTAGPLPATAPTSSAGAAHPGEHDAAPELGRAPAPLFGQGQSLEQGPGGRPPPCKQSASSGVRRSWCRRCAGWGSAGLPPHRCPVGRRLAGRSGGTLGIRHGDGLPSFSSHQAPDPERVFAEPCLSSTSQNCVWVVVVKFVTHAPGT